jgi:hypothetical protein
MKLLFHDPIFIFIFLKSFIQKLGASAHFDHLSTKRETNEGTAICLKNRRGPKGADTKLTFQSNAAPLRCSSHTELEVTDIQNFRLPLR